MNPAFRLLLCALLIAGLSGVAVQQREISRLREEQANLAAQAKPEHPQAAKTPDLEQLRRDNEEVKKLKAETKDLPKLRNEARQLRQGVQDLARLRAENQRLTGQLSARPNPSSPPALPAGFISKEALQEVGLSTPEAAVQTFFHAASQGNFDRMVQCLDQAPPQGAFTENDRVEASRAFGGLPGIKFAGTEFQGQDHAMVGVQSSLDGEVMKVPVTLIGGEWRVSAGPR